ncbi:RluA family pseudouridine synthase [Desulfofustis glycolicus]|uniref:Pseudouridine synthase n=1 Tax=Desulfofustis glycolicus DSM 9705 TaxID=1121409 RepID=A0A1M5W6F6_9BACT|nr:RluA family pseudouridine synthase [Desulfofustis glycolicus]SHH83076.1 ribosomal large subunit pseudouridine synthase D [Desulfofustis glycolicus DSM 9705]
MAQPIAHTDSAPVSFTVPDGYHGTRLDHFLVRMLPASSRARIIAAVKAGSIVLNGTAVKAGHRLKGGDVIAGHLAAEAAETVAPRAQPVDFTVLHEDDALLVVAKPPGLVVHPGSGNRDGTLINGLLYRFRALAGVGDAARPGIVHRLDKDTSGVLVVARTAAVHRQLVSAFKERRVDKTYLALVHGVPGDSQGTVEAPIGRHPVHRQKMAVCPANGRSAISRWRVRQVFHQISLLEVTIETGRTHQIRVHLAAIGHPVVGDRLYGSNRKNERFPRQMLHAWRLCFAHPVSGENLVFEAPLPADFTAALALVEDGSC